MSARGEAPAPQADPLELLEPGEDVFMWISRGGHTIVAREPVLAAYVDPKLPIAQTARRELYLGCASFDDAFSGDGFQRYTHVVEHFDAAASFPPADQDRDVHRVHGDLAAPDARASWRALVTGALAAIESNAASKIVCARSVRLRSDEPIDLRVLARSLARAEGTFRYLLREGDVTFAGASPERLVEKSGDVVRTEAVAGTASIDHGETPLDQRDKDKREHLAVVLAIEEALAPHALALEHAEQPLVRRVGRVEHLLTPFEGRVAPDTSVVTLAQALHPTPAVAGTPRGVALDFIAQHEGVERGWYAGPVGWFDSNGDGELAVALRCVRMQGTAVDLYAGAGIVSGSDPDTEFDETVLKMRSTLASLGFEIAQS